MGPINIHSNKDDGPSISAKESQPKYTVETLAIAVAAGSLAALFLGFVLGYCCGRKCRKNEEDNLPYPDTEYEYFEQRQNCHMRRSFSIFISRSWLIISFPFQIQIPFFFFFL